MKISMVLPRYFKWIGLVLFLIGCFIPDAQLNLDDVNNPIGLLIQILSFSGLIMMAASRIKEEDEWVQYIRLNSLQWAILIYMGLRIGTKILAFYLKDPDWLPTHLQANSLLVIFIVLFYTRAKLLPFLNRKSK